MAFQMISTNDIPEVMEGLRLDYHDGNGQWQIIVQLYFLRNGFTSDKGGTKMIILRLI